MPRREHAPSSLWSACLLLLLVLSVGSPVQAGRIPVQKLSWNELAAQPGGQQLLDRELHRQEVYHQRWHQVHDLLGGRHVSAKSRQWLAAQGLGPARLADPLARLEKSEPVTLRILLVRISFETNREPDLTTIPADGDFMLGQPDPDDPLPIDPPPHNRAFFESHLRGLSEFYRYQSGGLLTIESRVLPEGDEDSYKVSDVADYGPGASGFWTLQGLETLVRDMIDAADAGTQADGSADLGDYDDDHPLTYIIFAHAGSDWQSDINQDSPNDIPTFFVTLGEPHDLLGGGRLSECSVIPETTYQDDYRGSIAAALYHEFGHALGLPDVYDATTGLTSVGIWDLMDSGTNLSATIGVEDPDAPGEIIGLPVTGILPPSLSAWCKWFLGWVDVGLVPGGEATAYQLPAVGVPRAQYRFHNDRVSGNAFDESQPQVLIGGISSREFFLVENRWVPLSEDDTPYDPYDPETGWGGLYFQTDPTGEPDERTGVVLYLGGDIDGVEGYNTGYYDYFLPEGGLLVWHVDMDRIEANLADNSINMYGDGLKLVEADGIQDIGVLDAYVLGWYGSERDPFAPWNAVGYTELFPQGAGVPTSRANDRSWTGLHLWDIADDGQAHGAVMALQATVEPVLPGWPVELPAARIDDAPTARALDVASVTPLTGSDGRDLVFACAEPTAGEDPWLFAWTDTGDAAYPAPDETAPDFAVTVLGDVLAGPPAAVTLTGGQPALLLGSRDGTVRAFTPDAAFTELWSVSLGDTLLAGCQPIPLDEGGPWLFLAIDGAGRGHLLDEDGQAVGEPRNLLGLSPAAPVAPLRVLDHGGDPAILVCAHDGWRLASLDADGFTDGDVTESRHLASRTQLAVVPRGGSNLLLTFADDGYQAGWLVADDGGVALVDWPDPGAALVCEPAVADLDGDGNLDVIAATAQRLFAWQDNGTLLNGFPAALADIFPLPDTTRVAGPLLVADLAGDARNELLFATDQGHLFSLDGTGQISEGTPFRFGGSDGSNLIAVPRQDGLLSLALASRGGLVGAPLETRFTHGRLALYGEQVQDLANRSAGWFGIGGGPSRTGTVGEPRAVEGADPATRGQDNVVFYPNPLTSRNLSVRFFSATDRTAELAIYNLQGQVVLKRRLAAEAGRINEHSLDLDVASGLYLARLTCETSAGKVTDEVRTLAVAR